MQGCRHPAALCSSPGRPPDCEYEPHRPVENSAPHESGPRPGGGFDTSKTNCTTLCADSPSHPCAKSGPPHRISSPACFAARAEGWLPIASDLFLALETTNET